jgi:NTP pyrophosphatase (non-canonical NTP hydrolase)
VQSWLGAVGTPLLAQKMLDAGFLAEGIEGANGQILALTEEFGEFVAEYRRWSGQARRRGDRDKMELELADLVISCYITAHRLSIDLDARVAEKVTVILERPGREV